MDYDHSIDTGLPLVILHNTISLDGAMSGFQIDEDLHYKMATALQADAYLIGAHSFLHASDEIPPEEEGDFLHPGYDHADIRPFLLVVDSQGRLKGKLHYYRKMSYIKDLIVLISDSTSRQYQVYLKERHYPFVKAGKEKVEFKQVFQQLKDQYHIDRILTDTGPVLGNALLAQNMIDELSLLVAPMIVAKKDVPKIMTDLDLESHQISLQTLDCKNLGNNHLWLRYKVQK